MADMQTYNHHDIQRYLRHKMTPQEMHAFEKALMDDPFLADALEGFSASDAELTVTHLSEIESELKGEKQKGKVVAMPLQKRAWWKVAAVVLVVITGGALSYSLLMQKGAEKDVAQQTAPTEAVEMATKNDSVGPAEKPLAQEEALQEKKSLPKPKNTSEIIKEEKKAPSSITQSGELNADSERIAMAGKSEESSALMDRNADTLYIKNAPATSSAGEAISSRKAALPVKPEYEFKGRVLDQTGEPVSGASIIIDSSNIGTSADANGNFQLKSADSVIKVSVAAVGIAAKEIIKSNSSNNNIIVNRQEGYLSEVVITPVGPRLINNEAEAVPKGGWRDFVRYFLRQKNSLRTDTNYNYNEQEVELEFIIDNRGRPRDIRVLKQADKIIAEKAIVILQNGPKWKSKKKNKRVQLILPF